MNALQTFANGDTTYVPKLNNNFSGVKSAIDALELNVAAQIGAALTGGQAFSAMFGPSVALIGGLSCVCTGSGATLTVDAGYYWNPTTTTVVRRLVSSTIDFTALAAATYYVIIADTGVASSSTSAVNGIYSVVWTGAAFGAITRTAVLVFGAADDVLSQTSTALGAVYVSVDARLEAGETKAVAGDLARTWLNGRLSKSVAGAADVTLTAVEANNAILNFTGALTGNINVIVPLGTNPREWIITNSTTGAFTLTVKGATGTGVAVAQAGLKFLFQDGTNVVDTAGGGGSVTSVSVTTVNGVSGTVATPTTTPAISLTLGAITPTSVAATGAVTGSNLSGTNTGDQTITLTGDVTGTGTGSFAATVAANAVTNAKAAQMAAHTFKGNNTAATANALDLTIAQLTAEINAVVGDTGAGGTKGLAPAPGAGDAAAGKFLKADGTYAVPAGTSSGTVTSVAQTVPAFLSIAGSPVTTAGTLAITFSGTALPVANGGTGSTTAPPFDLTAFYPGVPTSGAVVARVPVARAVTFPINFAGSYGVASVAATASTAFDVQKNGTSVGTITFAAAASTATFVAAASTVTVAGDVMKIVAPATADATLADPGFVLVGTR